MKHEECIESQNGKQRSNIASQLYIIYVKCLTKSQDSQIVDDAESNITTQ